MLIFAAGLSGSKGRYTSSGNRETKSEGQEISSFQTNPLQPVSVLHYLRPVWSLDEEGTNRIKFHIYASLKLQ